MKNINRILLSLFVALILVSSVSSQQNYLFPSRTNPAGKVLSEVTQFVCIGWDGNGYTGLDATPYENAIWDTAQDDNKWGSIGRVGGKAPFDHSWAINTDLPNNGNPDNIQEGDMGMSWAVQTLATGDMKMTFNVISGQLQTVFGAWDANPDSVKRLGYNYESFKDVDLGDVTKIRYNAVCWGREYANPAGANNGDVLVKNSTITSEAKGWLDTNFVPSDHFEWEQPNWIQLMYSKTLAAGHEIGNNTLDGMGLNSPLPLSKWPNNLEGRDQYPTKDLDQYGNAINEEYQIWDEIGWSACAGNRLSKDGWRDVITLGDSMLVDYLKVGVHNYKVMGFRAPAPGLHATSDVGTYRAINSNLFFALKDKGYEYDCSILADLQYGYDGTNAFWPYTLDNGSESIWAQKVKGKPSFIDSLPTELWELPISIAIVPEAIRNSVRNKAQLIDVTFEASVQKDASFWLDWLSHGRVEASDKVMFIQWGMTKEEWLATMKNTLDKRIQNNKAPLIINANTDIYTPMYDYTVLNSEQIKSTYGKALESNTYEDRIVAMEEFRDYALLNSVKFITHSALIDSLIVMKGLVSSGQISDYVNTWNFVKNPNLNSSTSTIQRPDLENVTIQVDAPNGSEYPYASFVSTDPVGRFAKLDHISLNYTSNAPLALQLLVEDDENWEVVLNNIGPNVYSGKIPLHAFHYNTFNLGSKTSLDPSKIRGMAIKPLTTNKNVEVVNFSVDSIKLFGPDPYVPDLTPPANVTNVTASSNSTSTIDISWTASISTDTDSLLVAWGNDSIGDINDAKTNSFAVVPLGTSSYTIQGLTHNTTYEIKIFANDYSKNWNVGVPAIAKTMQIITGDTLPPENITGLTATEVTVNSVNLGWVSSVSADAGIQMIAWSKDSIGDVSSAFNKDTATLSKSVILHSITNLEDATQYFVKVFVADTGGLWNGGSEIKVVTDTADEVAPVNVSNLTIDSTNKNDLVISWDYADKTDVDSVIVSWSTSAIGDVEEAKNKLHSYVNPGDTVYKVDNLIQNTFYNLKVFLSDSLGNWNNGVSVGGKTDQVVTGDTIPPEPISELSALALSHKSIEVKWKASTSTDVKEILVAWSTDDIDDVTDAKSKSNISLSSVDTTYTIDALDESTTYNIKVFVTDTAGNWSGGVKTSATTDENVSLDTIAPEAVTSLTASAKSDTEIKLSWVSSESPDAKTILIAWSEGNINDVSDAKTKSNVELADSLTSYTITGLTLNTFYNIRVFVQDTAGLYSFGAAATAKTDSTKPVEIFAGDFNGDLKIDVVDFSFVSTFWSKTANGETDSLSELAPYYGEIPTIIVDPDGKFNHRDLSVFTSACYWYYDENRIQPLANRGVFLDDNYITVESRTSKDATSLSLNCEANDNLLAASFVISFNPDHLTYEEIVGGMILGVDINNTFTFERKGEGVVKIISTYLSHDNQNAVSESLLSIMFERLINKDTEIFIDYELVNSNNVVYKRSSKKISIGEVESDDKSLDIVVVPNPSVAKSGYSNQLSVVSESRVDNSGGFYINLSDFSNCYINTLTIYDMLSNVINKIDINTLGSELDGKMIYWSGYNRQNRPVTSGNYYLLLEYRDSKDDDKLSVTTIGVKN